MIKISNLDKYFNKGRQNEIHVINNVSLELPERGMVAIFGKSGCGKTTLLNVIGGLDRFSGGSLSVNGQNIRKDPDALRNREMGYIFQNYNLNKSETCYDNVADALRLCGMKGGWQMRERVTAALANVGMENFASRTPDTLSGGQQQRIAIARAIVKNPHVILADEPTGNLDEANTLLVMDLLHEISRDHLVLLVTHEADLVDHYCETVIELCDGRVVEIRNNESANGLRTKDKNDIYLGELPKRTERLGNAVSLDYYGDAPIEPIKVRVVNDGGRFYLQVDTAGVRVLDPGSEIKLREGVFEVQKAKPRDGERIDMSKLPPVNGSHYGRLYTLRSAIKSGWRANFSRRRKSKKFLLGLMSLFSMVLVLMTSLFGTSFRTIINARSANSANTFYVYTDSDGAASDRLLAALNDPESGIDDLRLVYGNASGDETVRFKTGFFETSAASSGSVKTHAVYLNVRNASALRLLAGQNTNLSDADLLITSALADELLKNSTLGYLSDYNSLIGLTAYGMNFSDWDTPNVSLTPRIAGVVESSEAALYMSDMALAYQSLRYETQLVLTSAAKVGYTGTLSPGNAVFYASETVSSKALPKVGDKIQVHGVSLTIGEIVRFQPLEANIHSNTKLVICRDDYLAIAARNGETSAAAYDGNSYSYEYEEYEYEEAEIEKAEIVIGNDTIASVTMDSSARYYTAVHSNAPEKTAAWLEQAMRDLAAPKYTRMIYTPSVFYEEILSESMEEIVSNFISMAVIVVILCVCIYFIMRSSLMKGIREVGIYRAIGVTKKNLIYRFLIESAVLTALTTLVGFLLSSAIMRLWLHATPLMEQIFYYPLWLAACLLVLIVGVCLLCGVLPAITLLRKTPSEILAKYDI